MWRAWAMACSSTAGFNCGSTMCTLLVALDLIDSGKGVWEFHVCAGETLISSLSLPSKLLHFISASSVFFSPSLLSLSQSPSLTPLILLLISLPSTFPSPVPLSPLFPSLTIEQTTSPRTALQDDSQFFDRLPHLRVHHQRGGRARPEIEREHRRIECTKEC